MDDTTNPDAFQENQKHVAKEALRTGVKCGIMLFFISLLVSTYLLPAAGLNVTSQAAQQLIDVVSKMTIWQQASFCLPVIFVGPFKEELLYRAGMLAPVMIVFGNGIILFAAALSSSILFALMHGSWVNLFIQGFMGLVLAKIFSDYKLPYGFIACYSAHATNNALCMVTLMFSVYL